MVVLSLPSTAAAAAAKQVSKEVKWITCGVRVGGWVGVWDVQYDGGRVSTWKLKVEFDETIWWAMKPVLARRRENGYGGACAFVSQVNEGFSTL